MAKYKTNETIVVLKFTFFSCEFPTIGTDIVHSDILYNIKIETCFLTEDFYCIKIFFGSFSFSKFVEESVVYDQSIAIVDLV